MTSPQTFDFIMDPGHGWLEVPYRYLHFLNITDKISCCSHVHGSNVYLEEDNDAPLFLEACKNAQIEVKFNHINYDDEAPPRNYCLYEPNCVS